MAKGMSAKEYDAAKAKAAADRAAQKAAQTKSPIWSLPDFEGVEVIVQFLDDWDDFQMYRWTEAAKFKHVSGEWETGPSAGRERKDIPYGLQRVPVEDYEPPFTENNPTEKIKWLNGGDLVNVGGLTMNLVTEVLSGEGLFQYRKDDHGDPRVETKFMGNVLVHSWPATLNKRGKERTVPEAGSVVLLNIRKTDYDKIKAALKQRATKEKYDIANTAWGIEVRKEKESDDRTTRIVEVTPYRDIPCVTVNPSEWHDANDAVDSLRSQLLGVANAVFADFLGESPLWTPGDEETRPAPDFAQEGPTTSEPLDSLSNTALAAKLKAAGVTPPTRAKKSVEEYRAELIAMASASL